MTIFTLPAFSPARVRVDVLRRLLHGLLIGAVLALALSSASSAAQTAPHELVKATSEDMTIASSGVDGLIQMLADKNKGLPK